MNGKQWRKFAQRAGLIMVAGVWSLHVYAADIVVEQKDVQFWFNGKALKSTDEVPAKVGDTLRIVNMDKVIHNTFSFHEKLPFDSGAQKPKSEGGEDYLVKLQSPGVFDIACAIHPGMAFKVKAQ